MENKKEFLRNDRRLVCSMFAVYGLCILSLITVTLWGLDRRSRRISAEATSTGFTAATQQARSTGTAIARATGQAQYQYVDWFDSNRNHWRTGVESNKYWFGDIRIEEGVYLWQVERPYDTFVSWAEFATEEEIKDFDVYVDTKILDADPGDACSGLIFKLSPYGWDEGGYSFRLCNNSTARISYHDKKGWQNIAAPPYLRYRPGPWNRLEISARGTHFTFSINGEQLYEMDDERQKTGGPALIIELNRKAPGKILFDNFGYQGR